MGESDWGYCSQQFRGDPGNRILQFRGLSHWHYPPMESRMMGLGLFVPSDDDY